MTDTRRWLLFAAAACLLLRAPAFRSELLSDDEAIYDTMAREVTKGGVMYRDTVDHKPPGLVYSYAAMQWLTGPAGTSGAGAMAAVHLLGLLAALCTCFFLYRIGLCVLAPGLAAVPPLLYAVASSAKVPWDGLAVNGELLLNAATALGVLFALEGGKRRRLALDLAAGALIAVATLYKYQAAVVGLALPALLLGDRPVRALGRSLAWALGFVAPLALCAAYFQHRDALLEALRWGVDFNRHYLADGPSLGWALQRLSGSLAVVVLPSALLYGAGLAALFALLRRQQRALTDVVAARAFLVLWSLLALASVALGARFFGHYFLQPELPLALLAAGPLSRLQARAPRRFAGALAAPALFFALLATFPELSLPYLDPDQPDYRSLGAAIEERTLPADTIWVWGNAPQLYHVANRRQGVRFSFCNYLTGLSPATPSEYDPGVDPAARAVPWAWPLALEDLERRRPALIVDTAAAGLKGYGKFPIARFPAFARYLAAHYQRDGEVSGVVLYRRSN